MANPVKIRAEVSEVRRYGEGTYAVRMAPAARLPRFRAGQFLHLTIDDYDPAGGFWPESRVFSIASTWGDPELEIVYSVKGAYTGRMESFLAPGKEVWLKLPYGTFVIETSLPPSQDAVLVAGGTGVSPFLPFIGGLHAGQESPGDAQPRGVRLYYGVRCNDMLLARELLQARAREGLLDAVVYVEQEAPDGSLAPPIRPESGRLDIGRIHRESADLRDPHYFLSGPPAMIAAFKDGLSARGTDESRIHIDEWE